MANTKTGKFKNNKSLIISFIICITLTILLLVSLVFRQQLEYLLYLKPNLSMLHQNSLQVHFVDVGQGDGILIRFPSGETMLIDAGRPESRENLFNYIDNVFLHKGETGFDYVVLTHADSDHCGSMPDVIDKYDIDVFFRPSTTSTIVEGKQEGLTYQTSNVYAEVIRRLEAKKNSGEMDVLINSSGNKIDKGELSIEFIAPLRQDYKNLNDVSPFLLITYQQKRILLTGDAEKPAEADVVQYAQDNNIDLDVDVLKLGHHGSNTSTTQALLDLVKPEYAVISVGLNNTYNHPSPEILDRLMSYSQSLYDNTYQTSLKGNIICYVQDGNLAFTFIKDANSYLYIDYYICVIVAVGVVWIAVFAPSLIITKSRKKYKQKTSRNK